MSHEILDLAHGLGINFETIFTKLGVLTSANAEVASTKLEVSAEASASGAASNAVDSSEACIPETDVAAEAVINDQCKGAIDALMRLGLSEDEATNLAIKLHLYDPDYLHGDDPAWPESAALQQGTYFVKHPDGSIEVFKSKEVFENGGTPIASVDCQGNVNEYTGKMMNSTVCKECEGDTGYAAVGEPQEVAPEVARPRVVPILTTVDCDGHVEYRNFLVFDSEAQARAFFADKENAREFLASLQGRGNCIYISDGIGSVQTIEFEVDSKGNPIMKDGLPVLDDKVKTTTFDNGRHHMSDKTFQDKYLRGLGSPSDVRHDGVADIRKSDVIPGAAQELRFNPETDRWEYAPRIEAVQESANAIVASAGLDESTFPLVADMQLPAEFADPHTSIAERAEALIREAAKRGVTMDKQGATNLARILTEGEGKDGGLPQLNERGFAVPVTNPDGTRLTLGQAIVKTSAAITDGVRASQGVPSGS